MTKLDIIEAKEALQQDIAEEPLIDFLEIYYETEDLVLNLRLERQDTDERLGGFLSLSLDLLFIIAGFSSVLIDSSHFVHLSYFNYLMNGVFLVGAFSFSLTAKFFWVIGAWLDKSDDAYLLVVVIVLTTLIPCLPLSTCQFVRVRRNTPSLSSHRRYLAATAAAYSLWILALVYDFGLIFRSFFFYSILIWIDFSMMPKGPSFRSKKFKNVFFVAMLPAIFHQISIYLFSFEKNMNAI